MTKRKAIEAAVHCNCNEQGCSGKVWADIAAERAYEYGRIAGLREAAKIVCHFDGWIPGGSLPTIRKLASALAKKARTK